MQTDISNRISPGRRSRFALRMAPMIDMIFLLLIFFLVAGKWRPQENFLPFKLPTAQAGHYQFSRPEPLTIHIFATRSGCQVRIGQLHTVQIENETIAPDLAVLMEKIHQILLDQKRFATDPIEVVCAPQVKWDHLAKIYNLFFGAGLTDITFQMTEYDQNGHAD
jgi:biopolymer transport protein ExbD